MGIKNRFHSVSRLIFLFLFIAISFSALAAENFKARIEALARTNLWKEFPNEPALQEMRIEALKHYLKFKRELREEKNQSTEKNANDTLDYSPPNSTLQSFFADEKNLKPSNIHYSWKELIFKANSPNLSKETWIIDFARLVSQDENRLASELNFYMTPTDAHKLKSIHDKIETNLELSKKDLEIIKSVPSYNYHFKEVQNNPNSSSKKLLLKNLQDDIENFDFSKKSWLERISENEIRLFVKGPLSKEKKERISLALKYFWRHPSEDLVVTWQRIKKTDSRPAIKFCLVNEDFTPNCDMQKGIVNISGQTSLNIIAHELGHALGFADEYYEIYDGNGRYTAHTIDGNIMASQTGFPTTNHWEKLKSKYPCEQALTLK